MFDDIQSLLIKIFSLHKCKVNLKNTQVKVLNHT